MMTLITKLIFVLFGIIMLSREASAVISVIALLSALTLTSLNQYFSSKRFTIISSTIYILMGSFYPTFCPFLPLFCFDLLISSWKVAALSTLIPIISHTIDKTSNDTAFLFMLIALAVLTQYLCKKTEHLNEENKRIIDDSSELNRMLAQKNENLIEKYDYEIHLTMLKERNRIAREIHDNVGHILSRSILQMGAMQAINKDTQMSEHISGLKDTLSLAMDSIRNSVHGLRDESINLHESIHNMTDNLGYEINIDYDVIQDFPNNIKYCFLTVLKEAITNISKHSDTTRIRIAVHEHPAMYQLLIHDNGTKNPYLNSNLNKSSGMGLYNMEERVAAFSGNFSASYKNGFRIFISIPKQEEIANENNTR